MLVSIYLLVNTAAYSLVTGSLSDWLRQHNRDKEVVPSMKGEPKERNNSAMLFNTALIKAGSKSFKDPQVATLSSYVVCHSFEIVYTSQACGFALYPEI